MPSLKSQERTGKHRVDRNGGTAEPAPPSPSRSRSRGTVWAIAGILFVAGTAVGIFSQWWWPHLQLLAGGEPAALAAVPGNAEDAAAPASSPGGTVLALANKGARTSA